MFEDLCRDLRYGVRSLRMNPGFTATVVLTLAVAIGANTAIFSVVNAVLLRPLPYQDPGRLVMMWTDDPKHDVHEEGVSYPNFDDWRSASRSFEDMAFCSRRVTATITGGQEPELVQPAVVSVNLFGVLGVPPILGRLFAPEEVQRGDHVVVVSHSVWVRRFGALPDAVGKTLEVDGVAWRVVGVMPASFQFPEADTAFWQPLTAFRAWPGIQRDRYGDWGRVVGRLKPEVSVTQAQTEMTAIGKRLELANPVGGAEAADFAGFGVNVVPLTLQVTGRDLPFALWVLFGAVVSVLLIACANVASLLLARGVGREREIAVRRALGAQRGRIFRHLLIESLLLAGSAGTVGVALAAAVVHALMLRGSAMLPRLREVQIDVRVMAFALGVSLAAAVLCGVAPALRLSQGGSGSLTSRTPQSGRGTTRVHHLLVIVEVALSAVLLCGAGLLIRSFLRVQAVDPGFEPGRVLTMRVAFPGTWQAAMTFHSQVLERVRALPGVTRAGFVEDVLQRRNPDFRIAVEGQAAVPGGPLSGDAASPEFFEAIGARLLSGRLFSDRDEAGSPRVAVINETMARRFWPGEDSIGKRFRTADAHAGDPWCTVIGVVADMHRNGLERQPIAQVFWPLAQRPVATVDFVIRTATDPARLADLIRGEIRAIDRRVPVFQMTTLEALLDDSVASRRFQSFLLAWLSAIALALAAIGVYGLMHYGVVQRTYELGIRLALGARSADVLGMVLREGASLALIGLAAGMVASLWLTRVLSSLLFGITATDPLTLTVVPALIGAATVLACGIPACRAMRIDPLTALRRE